MIQFLLKILQLQFFNLFCCSSHDSGLEDPGRSEIESQQESNDLKFRKIEFDNKNRSPECFNSLNSEDSSDIDIPYGSQDFLVNRDSDSYTGLSILIRIDNFISTKLPPS